MQRSVGEEEWAAMFREIGLDDKARTQWHQLFEERHPQGPEDFLKWLGLSSEGINRIRKTDQA